MQKNLPRALWEKLTVGNRMVIWPCWSWGNTPSEIFNSSLAQRLFARRSRTQVPVARSLLKPSVVQTGPGLQERKRKQARYYNRGATELAELKPGQIVRFRPPGSTTRVKAQVDKTSGHSILQRSHRRRTQIQKKSTGNPRNKREGVSVSNWTTQEE